MNDSAEAGRAGIRVDPTAGKATDTYGDADTLVGIETIRDSDLTDTIAGSEGDTRLSGRGGDDETDARGGKDMLDGGAGTII